jgi:acyl-CoA hydrolase
MKNYNELYKEKLVTAEEAVKKVKSGDWIDWAMFNGKPVELDKALAARKDELSDIKIMAAVTVPPVPEVILKDPKGEVFTYNDQHFSLLTRILQDQCSGVFYQPTLYGESELYLLNAVNDPKKMGTPLRDHFMVQTGPMDKDGYFNWGMHNSCCYLQAIHSKNIIIEVNNNIPYAYGGNMERIHISQVQAVVEGANTPLAELPAVTTTETDKKIAEHVLAHIKDGDCIQLGIGGMPNVLGKMISQSDLKDLGGWTEMLVDAYHAMWEAGVMTGMK